MEKGSGSLGWHQARNPEMEGSLQPFLTQNSGKGIPKHIIYLLIFPKGLFILLWVPNKLPSNSMEKNNSHAHRLCGSSFWHHSGISLLLLYTAWASPEDLKAGDWIIWRFHLSRILWLTAGCWLESSLHLGFSIRSFCKKACLTSSQYGGRVQRDKATCSHVFFLCPSFGSKRASLLSYFTCGRG